MEDSIDDLKRIKLEYEVQNLRKKFYQRPEFLAIVFSSIFAAVIIFISARLANSDELDRLKIEKRALDNQVYEIDNRKLVKQEVALKTSIMALERKEENLKNSVTSKYKKKLLDIEKDLIRIKDYYIRDFAIEYANNAVKSSRVRKKAESFVPKAKAKEFEKWLYSEIKRGIEASAQGTLNKVDFELQMQEIPSK